MVTDEEIEAAAEAFWMGMAAKDWGVPWSGAHEIQKTMFRERMTDALLAAMAVRKRRLELLPNNWATTAVNVNWSVIDSYLVGAIDTAYEGS